MFYIIFIDLRYSRDLPDITKKFYFLPSFRFSVYLLDNIREKHDLCKLASSQMIIIFNRVHAYVFMYGIA